MLHGAYSWYGRILTSIVQPNSQLNNSGGNGNSFAVIDNRDTTTTKDTTAATRNLLYVIPVILHNKENKVRIYAFIDPGSSLTILLAKTADELRLQIETRQQLILEGATGTDTKICYTTSTEIWNLEDDERYNLKQIYVVENINLPKLSTGETLPESMTTLDMSICQLWIISKSQYWLDRTTLTLSRQSSSAPSASLFVQTWLDYFWTSYSIGWQQNTTFNASYCFVLQQLPRTRQWPQPRIFSLVESRDNSIGIQNEVKWSRCS